MLARAIIGAALWEAAWWARRRSKRETLYAEALQEARRLGRPLVVIGAPDRGATRGPGCGDLTVDVQESSCPVTVQHDITLGFPWPDDSVVVFVSCVLEYVAGDFDAVMRELIRVSGGRLYVVRVEPWTATAYLYPGTKRVVTTASLRRYGART